MQQIFDDVVGRIQEMPMGVWAYFVVFIGVVIFLALRVKKNTQESVVNTRLLSFGAMCMALSFVLSYIKPYEMPQGGSVTAASMLPLLLFAFIAGPKIGFVAGTAYGFLQFLQSGYAAHWMSIVLDYPLAFAMLGLIGFVPKSIKPLEVRFAIGVFIAILGRFVAHVLSGAIFFAEYAGEMNPWIYSMGYNVGYLGVELIITVVVGIAVLRTPIYKTLKVALNQSSEIGLNQ